MSKFLAQDVFKRDDILAYINHLSDNDNLGIIVNEDKDIVISDRYITFFGHLNNKKSEKAFVIPFNYSFGRLSCLSILYGKNHSDLSWLIGGSASNSKTNTLFNNPAGKTLVTDSETYRDFMLYNIDKLPPNMQREQIEICDKNIANGMFLSEIGVSYYEPTEDGHEFDYIIVTKPLFEKSNDFVSTFKM